MNRTKLRPTDAATTLIPHLLTLATQAADQAMELGLTMDTHTSVDAALEPAWADGAVDIPVPPVQLGVLRRALLTEMRLQAKALAHTTDALYLCASRLAGKQR